jgi:hypothetical protein
MAMVRRFKSALCPIGSIPLLALAACGPGFGEDSDNKSSSAIVGGTVVTHDTLGSAEFLECPGAISTCTFASSRWGCSGNMVADRWFLTAHHCVTAGGELSTGGTAVTAKTIRVQSADGASYGTGQKVFRHPTLDVALVYLDQSIVNASGQILSTPIFTGTSASLVGKNVYCQGFGLFKDGCINDFGTLRSAVMNVWIAGPGSIYMQPNAAGNYLAPGDSGAPCFLHSPGGSSNAIVAINSFEDLSPFPCHAPMENGLVGADGFQSWAADIIASYACQAANATCGSITDALGTVVPCGTCGTGDVCVENTCQCAPPFPCPAHTLWNPAVCACEAPPHCSCATCCM